MGVTTYYSAGGELLGHRTDVGAAYGTDALGSVTVTAIDDQQRIPTNYYYKPYGSRLNKLGNNADPRYLWNGTSGYRETAISHSKSYVQARHLGQEEGRWTTVDPLWPAEEAFQFCRSSPVFHTDVSGKQVSVVATCLLGHPCNRWSEKKKCEVLHKMLTDAGYTDFEGAVACCDGNPTICIYGRPGIPAKYKGAYDACTRRHENVHVRDKQCIGLGFRWSGSRDDDANKRSECKAYKESWDCFKAQRNKCTDSVCRQFWDGQMEEACMYMHENCKEGDIGMGIRCG